MNLVGNFTLAEFRFALTVDARVAYITCDSDSDRSASGTEKLRPCVAFTVRTVRTVTSKDCR
jgi:hypothetical protein